MAEGSGGMSSWWVHFSFAPPFPSVPSLVPAVIKVSNHFLTLIVITNHHVYYVHRYCTVSHSLTPFLHLDHCVIPLEHSDEFHHFTYSAADVISKVHMFTHLEVVTSNPLKLWPSYVGVQGEGMYDVTVIHFDPEFLHYNPSALRRPATVNLIKLTSLCQQLVWVFSHSVVPSSCCACFCFLC